MVLVQLDGADTLLQHMINEESNKIPCRINSRVEVIFAEKTVGHMKDILGFRLLEGSDTGSVPTKMPIEMSKEVPIKTDEAIDLLNFSNRVQIPFSYTLGEIGTQFVQFLAQEKLMALHCPDCGFLNLPPSRFCYSCTSNLSQKQDWKVISAVGTTVGVAYLEKEHRKHLPEDVLGFALVKLKEMKTSFLHHLIDPNLKKGDPAQLLFRSQRKGSLLDIHGFRKGEYVGN